MQHCCRQQPSDVRLNKRTLVLPTIHCFPVHLPSHSPSLHFPFSRLLFPTPHFLIPSFPFSSLPLTLNLVDKEVHSWLHIPPLSPSLPREAERRLHASPSNLNSPAVSLFWITQLELSISIFSRSTLVSWTVPPLSKDISIPSGYGPALSWPLMPQDASYLSNPWTELNGTGGALWTPQWVRDELDRNEFYSQKDVSGVCYYFTVSSP